MILKRLGAIALAVILVGGAWLVRDRVIEDNGSSGTDDPPRADREIVCVSDLREACAALDDARDDLEIRIEDAGDTLDALAALEVPSEAPIWITMEPFPAMVDNLREIGRVPALAHAETPVATSPIALVTKADRAPALAAQCGGEPLQWRCVGDLPGTPWVEIGADVEKVGKEVVRPAFTTTDRAIGLLGVADAVKGYFGTSPINRDDANFLRWASRLAGAVPASALTGGTAIATLETRSSALDIAVGAVAEMSGTSVVDLTPQYADPMIRADVVVAVPSEVSLPRGLADDLTALLVSDVKWDLPLSEPNPLPTAVEMLGIRETWEDFT